MAGGAEGITDPYATPIGLIYVFNLIVGTGALALPKAFSDAGFALASAVLLVSCLISYINATFILEALSAANALLLAKKMNEVKKLAVERSGRGGSPAQRAQVEVYRDREESINSQTSAQQPLIPRTSSSIHLPLQTKAEYYEINKRTELSQLASLFLNKLGVSAVYLIMAVYLFGDLAIYAVVVPKSLMNVVCSGNGSCLANATAVDDSMLCRPGLPDWVTRLNMYRFMVVLFTCVVGPFVFVGMTKTKYLQILTIVARFSAFALMISFALKAIFSGQATGHPKPVQIGGFAKLFGITVYAFMCHHSLPAIVTPMRRKARLFSLFTIVFLLILAFYLTLSLTGSFAFAHVQDVYTLNFLNNCSLEKVPWYMIIVDYFLALFPVMTISWFLGMNFPVVGVTLSNNLRTMIFGEQHAAVTRLSSSSGQTSPLRRSSSEPNLTGPSGYQPLPSADVEHQIIVDAIDGDDDSPVIMVRRRSRLHKTITYRVLIPAAVLLFPVCVSLITDDVEFLASAVGAYAGVGVQFVIPCLLLIGSRRKVAELLTTPMPKKHASPFGHWVWPWLMFIWAGITITVVTINYIWTGK